MARRRKGRSRRKQGGNPHSPQQNKTRQATHSDAASTTMQPEPARQDTTSFRSQAQKRAADALEKVKALRDRNDYGNYRSYVKALPAKVIMNGLGQALAMEKAGAQAKNEVIRAGHEKLFKHMQDWLLTGWEHKPKRYRDKTDILAAITQGEESDYIRAQGEAMAYVEWLKKFAVAYLEDKDDPAEGGDDAAAS